MSARRINDWRSGKSRRRQVRPKKRRILVVCEGQETERNYFDLAKREPFAREHLTVTIKRGKGGSRRQIAECAVLLKEDASEAYDEVWCVMDAEKPSDRVDCEAALRMLDKHGIESCLSNPAFEVWLLSHFQKTTNAYRDRKAVVRDLNPHWKARFARDYEKAEKSIFTMLSSLAASAIANARWARENYHSNRPILDCNPVTDVYRFVERLLGPPKQSAPYDLNHRIVRRHASANSIRTARPSSASARRMSGT
jgi:hypothetical protein